jgi:hypothetical protein
MGAASLSRCAMRDAGVTPDSIVVALKRPQRRAPYLPPHGMQGPGQVRKKHRALRSEDCIGYYTLCGAAGNRAGPSPTAPHNAALRGHARLHGGKLDRDAFRWSGRRHCRRAERLLPHAPCGAAEGFRPARICVPGVRLASEKLPVEPTRASVIATKTEPCAARRFNSSGWTCRTGSSGDLVMLTCGMARSRADGAIPRRRSDAKDPR